MKQLVTYRPHVRFGLAVLAAAMVATVFAIYTQRAHGYDQDIAKLNRFVQSSKANTASMQIFREGRDFIEAQNWQKAAEKFNDFITGYPKDKDVDAALYWYGYALQKQDRKEEAAAPLLKLITRFPNSSWRREARTLLVVLGRKAEVDQALDRDNCEIKMLALQSLFEADRERAIGIVTEALRSNPGQCQGFQAAAVSCWALTAARAQFLCCSTSPAQMPTRRLRLTAIKRLGEQHSEQVTEDLIKIYDADQTKEIRAQVLRALVESRDATRQRESARDRPAGDDLPSRQVAIRYLGELKDAASLDELIRIYDADKTKEIRSQICGRWPSARMRVHVPSFLKSHARATRLSCASKQSGVWATTDVSRSTIFIQLYSSETNVQLKQGLLRAFSDSGDPRARAKLFEIARGNDPIELRGYAIRVWR